MSHEATARLRSHIRSKKWESYKLFLLALPVIIYIFVFKYMPLWGWSYAFFSYRPGLSLAQCDFVGLQNFENLFGNAVMRQNLFRVLRNTFGIQILNYVLMPVPMLFAIFLSEIKSKRFQKVIQTVTTLPHFISWVIMFSLASSIFGSSGLINSMIHDMGFEATINILTTDDHVWITQALLNLWKSMGWNAIVYFAAINSMDDLLDVMEQMMAAKPTEDDGTPNFGTVLNSGSDTSYWACMVMWYRMQGYKEDQLGYLLEMDMVNGTVSSILSKDSMYYKGLQWYNEAYRRGLVDPDSISNDRATQKVKVDSGYAMIPSGYLPGWAPKYQPYLVPGTKVYYNASRPYGDSAYMIGINAKTRNLDACLALRWVAPEKQDAGIDAMMGHCSADAALLMGCRRNANECFGACNRDGNPWQLSGGGRALLPRAAAPGRRGL